MEGSLGLSDVKNSLFIHPCLSFVTPTGRAPLHCYDECVTTLSHRVSTSILEFSTLPNFIQNTEKYLRNNSECLKLFYLMLLWSCCFWQETEKNVSRKWGHFSTEVASHCNQEELSQIFRLWRNQAAWEREVWVQLPSALSSCRAPSAQAAKSHDCLSEIWLVGLTMQGLLALKICRYRSAAATRHTAVVTAFRAQSAKRTFWNAAEKEGWA